MYRYRVEKITKIYDGDTIRCDVDLGFGMTLRGLDGGGQSFRLYGIDAPEVRGDERERGLESRNFLRDLMATAQETQIQSIKNEHDKYGRYLGIFYIKVNNEWINVNEHIVENGYAEKVDY